MAEGNAAVHESVDVVGRAASEVTPAVLAALVGVDGLQVVQVGSGSIQCVGTRRPRWATVLGVFGLLFVGLGLLFFFVRRTDRCTITVVDGPRGAVVTLSGTLDEVAFGRVRAVLDPLGVAPGSPQLASVTPLPGPGVWSAPAVAPPDPGLTVPPLAPPVTAWIPPSVPSMPEAAADAERTVARSPAGLASDISLHFDDGTVVAVGDGIALGRDPSPIAGLRPVQIVDATMSLSKTHAAVRRANGVFWLEDLHSTNGTSVVPPTGPAVALTAGQPVLVAPGAIVQLGDRRVQVLAG